MSQKPIDPEILSMMANADANAAEVIQSENTLGQRLPADVQGAGTLIGLEFSKLDASGEPGTDSYKPKGMVVTVVLVVDSPEKYSGFKHRVGNVVRQSKKRTLDDAYKAALDSIENAGYPRERREKFSSYSEIFADIQDWIANDSPQTGFQTYASGNYVNTMFTPIPDAPFSEANSPKETMYQGMKVKVLSEDGDQIVVEYLEGSKQGETRSVHRSDLG